MAEPPSEMSSAVEGDLLTNAYLPSDDQHIFNTPAFFKLHFAGRRAWFFQWRSRKSPLPVATFHVTETAPGVCRSPARGTYGGFSAAQHQDIFALEAFYIAAEEALRREGIKSLVLTQAPSSHDPALFSMVFNLLSRHRFVIENHELNYQLEVDETPFSDRISDGNAYKLRKCLRDGFQVSLLCADRHEEAYEIIRENQARKGLPVTMTYTSLALMRDTFPGHTQFWGAFNGGQLVGASVCLLVSARILYLFYWGFRNGLERYSPTVLLADAIYQWCLERRVSLLDIGISTVKGEPNRGLIAFKRRLGLREGLKLTFQKDFT